MYFQQITPHDVKELTSCG